MGRLMAFLATALLLLFSACGAGAQGLQVQLTSSST